MTIHRRRLLLHRAHLHGRRVRAQQHLVREEECVVQRPRRMVGGRVECLEVVVVGLDLGTLGHLVAHADEDVLYLAPRRGDQVQMAQGQRAAGQGDVDAVTFERTRELVGFQGHPPGFESRLEFALDQVAELAYARPLLGREFGDAAQEDGQLGSCAPRSARGRLRASPGRSDRRWRLCPPCRYPAGRAGRVA